MKTVQYMSLLVLSLFFVTGCRQEEKPAIVIDDVRITAKEFNDAFEDSALGHSQDAQAKEKFLEQFITKRLMLREGERLGLDKDPRFIRSLEKFWEQSLLNLVLAKKNSELSGRFVVNDQDIAAYFQAHQNTDFAGKTLGEVYDRIKWLMIKEQQSAAMSAWINDLKQRAVIKIEEQALGVKQ